MVHTPFQNIKVRFTIGESFGFHSGDIFRHQRDDDFRCARTNDEIFYSYGFHFYPFCTRSACQAPNPMTCLTYSRGKSLPVHNVNCSAPCHNNMPYPSIVLQPACCACCNNFVICGLYTHSVTSSPGCNRLISLTNDLFSRVSYPLLCHWLKCRRKPWLQQRLADRRDR